MFDRVIIVAVLVLLAAGGVYHAWRDQAEGGAVR